MPKSTTRRTRATNHAHFQFNAARTRERISANIALLSCACSDQALHVDLVGEPFGRSAELLKISDQLKAISIEIGGES